MIRKILIKNYRSIKKIEINNISNKLGLIGENSSGKSSILFAILTFLGEYNIKESDFRFDKAGNREDEITIGIGIEFDDFSIKRILENSDLNNNKPKWYSNALEESKGERRRRLESKAYLKDLRKNIKQEWGIDNHSNVLYFKIVYKYDKAIESNIFLTDASFSESIASELSSKEIRQIQKIIQPRYAYLHDERNFLGEGLGEVDSTTNKLFRLLLPSINIKKTLTNQLVDNTIISELSIPEINQYLLKRVQEETLEITNKLNNNLQDSYDDTIKISWQFSNQLFENIHIKTNFRFANIDRDIDFQSVGSGTRSMYKIVLLQTLLEMQRSGVEPVLFLLEEPELYLYPKLEKRMADFICTIAKEHQVMITTHSHMSIMSFDRGTLFKIFRENPTKHSLPITKIKPLESSLEVMQLLGYDITYLLGKEYLVFVEGKDDQKAYEYLVKTIFRDDISSKFMMLTSVSKLSMAVNSSVLKYINTNSKSVFIVDSDGGNTEKQKREVIDEVCKFDKELKKEDFSNKIVLTKYCMLECYTFEKALLKHPISDEDLYAKKEKFINDNIEVINDCLKDRKQKKLDDPEIVSLSLEDKFEHIRKYGFTKKLIKTFRRTVGGSGFKRIVELNKEELELYCVSLIQDLKNAFNIT